MLINLGGKALENRCWENFTLEEIKQVAVITIDHPPLNILTKQLLEELNEVIDAVSEISDCRAVILRAMGEKSFVAGADILQFPNLSSEAGFALVEFGKAVFERIATFPAPVICAINGLALGGGLELAIACDIRIAEEHATFGLPETGLGIIPGYSGTQRLTRLVGLGKAKEIVFTGEFYSAQDAFEMGLVEQVVAKGESYHAAKAMAEKIVSKGPIAIAKAKIAINKGFEMSLQEAHNLESTSFSELCSTRDMQEGVQAFIEKRKPEFKNQ